MVKCITIDIRPGKNIGDPLEIEMESVWDEKPLSDALYEAVKKATLGNPELVQQLEEEFEHLSEDPMLIGMEMYEASLKPTN